MQHNLVSLSPARAGRLASALLLACGAVLFSGPASSRAAGPGEGAKTDTAAVGDPFAILRLPSDGPDQRPRPLEANAPAAGMTFDRLSNTLEIHVSDAELSDVLRMLSAQSQRNIVASVGVTGKVTCNLFDVTVEQALDAILRSSGYVARTEGDFIYVYTTEEVARMREAGRHQETRIFRLFHIPPESAAKLIEPSLSKEASVSFSDAAQAGVGTSRTEAGGYSYSGGDRLIVRDYPDNLEEVETVVAEIDQRPEQVLIEATILSTKLTENNSFGVDFNVVGGVDFSQFASQNGQITSAQVGPGGGGTQNSVGTGNSFTSPITGGLKVGFVSNNVSAFVAALEGITDTTVLANPKVLALNKQRGEVLVGREDGYLTTTLTETTATQSVEFLSTGTRLIFRPFISRDGFIRLEIHPEDSQGGLNASNLPFKTTTEVTSNVMVKDGRTIVIGGLFRESATVGRSQVPVLGSIPILGALFRRQNDATTREEIIILLTPHVVKDHDKYADLSEAELQRAEKLRVGRRKGMMPTGRERMSQNYYERAVRELAKPDADPRRAEFFLNAATNLNPSFIEAIELKQRVTGRAITEADGSTIRGFVRRAALEDIRGGPRPRITMPDHDPLLPQPQDELPDLLSGAGEGASASREDVQYGEAAGKYVFVRDDDDDDADGPAPNVVRLAARPDDTAATGHNIAASQPTTKPARERQWVDVRE